MLTRRALIESAVSLSLCAAAPRVLSAAADDAQTINLRVAPDKLLATIPGDFVGLGYEESSIADPHLLSAVNEPYVHLVRNLGRRGVLRAGGIVADFTSYAASGEAVAQPKHTVITRASLERLRGYLDAVGWTAIWSVNFGRGTLEEAILEAESVAGVLGPRLLAIELGNEVENYSHGAKPLRHPPYTYADYRAEYTRWHAAIVRAVPGLHFAAPDTAASIEWVERMAADAHGSVQLLTTHYYRGDQKLGTRDQLMQADKGLQRNLLRLRHASGESGIPWRMCETNSFFGGGRPGVSDTMAGALWTLDYMLLLAQAGCSGVNIETGVNQLGFVSSYSPIRDDGAGHIAAGAPYYGMLAFAAAVRDAPDMLGVDYDPGSTNLTAYALGAGGHVRTMVLINKTLSRDARVSLREMPMRNVATIRLVEASAAGQTGVTLGGAAVSTAGNWRAEGVRLHDSEEIAVPANSAVVLRALE